MYCVVNMATVSLLCFLHMAATMQLPYGFDGLEGEWKQQHQCPIDRPIVCGGASKQQTACDGADCDYTGVQGMKINCCTLETGQYTETVLANGPPSWRARAVCPVAAAACGLHVRLLLDQRQGDDMGITGLSFACCDLKTGQAQGNATLDDGEAGDWQDVAMCPYRRFISTMRARQADFIGIEGDITLLNGLRFDCQTICAPGEFAVGTSCLECPSGTYQDEWQQGACKPWRRCPELSIETVKPSLTSDRVCTECPDGQIAIRNYCYIQLDLEILTHSIPFGKSLDVEFHTVDGRAASTEITIAMQLYEVRTNSQILTKTVLIAEGKSSLIVSGLLMLETAVGLFELRFVAKAFSSVVIQTSSTTFLIQGPSSSTCIYNDPGSRFSFDFSSYQNQTFLAQNDETNVYFSICSPLREPLPCKGHGACAIQTNVDGAPYDLVGTASSIFSSGSRMQLTYLADRSCNETYDFRTVLEFHCDRSLAFGQLESDLLATSCSFIIKVRSKDVCPEVCNPSAVSCFPVLEDSNWDLSIIASSEPGKKSNWVFTNKYHLSTCGCVAAAPDLGNCAGNAGICHVKDGVVDNLGQYASSFVNDAGNLVFFYQNGKFCEESHAYASAEVEFICDPAPLTHGPAFVRSVHCHHFFIWHSIAACSSKQLQRSSGGLFQLNQDSFLELTDQSDVYKNIALAPFGTIKCDQDGIVATICVDGLRYSSWSAPWYYWNSTAEEIYIPFPQNIIIASCDVSNRVITMHGVSFSRSSGYISYHIERHFMGYMAGLSIAKADMSSCCQACPQVFNIEAPPKSTRPSAAPTTTSPIATVLSTASSSSSAPIIAIVVSVIAIILGTLGIIIYRRKTSNLVDTLPSDKVTVPQSVIDEVICECTLSSLTAKANALFQRKFTTDLTELHLLQSQQVSRTLQKLGDGSYGEVWKGTVTMDKLKINVAIKTLTSSLGQENGDTEVEEQDLRRMLVQLLVEARVQSQMKHPNIVGIIGIQEAHFPIEICLEFCKEGDLKKYIQANPSFLQLPPPSKAEICILWMKHVISALQVGCRKPDVSDHVASSFTEIPAFIETLQLESLLHNTEFPLTTRSVLLQRENKGTVAKLADLGLARAVSSQVYYYTKKSDDALPLRWQDPISLETQKYSFESDIYSFGVLLYEVFSGGKTPFQGMQSFAAVHAARQGARLVCDAPWAPDGMQQLVDSCRALNASTRPKVEDIENQLDTVSMNSNESQL